MNPLITLVTPEKELLNGKNVRRVSAEVLKPPEEEIPEEIHIDHTSEPIKNIDDIYSISDYFISNGKYRDNMLFIVGINFGLRVSDLLKLRFSNLINDDLTFKTTFPVWESKPNKTRKRPHNRYITINDAVVDAVLLYLQHSPSSLSDYMFRSESNRGSNVNKPIDRKSADRIIKNAVAALGIDIHASTHTLRKTFAYHQMLMSNHDPQKLLLLQKMFGHSSVTMTLDYIGITKEDIETAYKDLNLGLRTESLIDSVIGETG